MSSRIEAYSKETVEILLINPLYPPILGDFEIWGTPPDPRQEVSCTSFSAVAFTWPLLVGDKGASHRSLRNAFPCLLLQIGIKMVGRVVQYLDKR